MYNLSGASCSNKQESKQTIPARKNRRRGKIDNHNSNSSSRLVDYKSSEVVNIVPALKQIALASASTTFVHFILSFRPIKN